MKRTVQKHILRGALALSVLVLALAATAAHASTAANTQITNTATVNYRDAGGVAQTAVTASVTVTVTLVGSAPLLDSPPNQTIAQGTSATLTYTITGTANGPDTYTLSDVAPMVNLAGATVTLPPNPVLGGTTLAADALVGANTITVPYDGNGNADVNGIAALDRIVIANVEYAVQSVAKNAAANTATITLTTNISAGALAGTIVGERQSFVVTVASGTVQGNNSSGTVTVTTTATSTAGSHATSQATPTVITVQRPVLTVTKTVSTDGGANFGPSTTAAPGTTLVYKIVAHNGGATPANSVTFTDVIPAYLTYVAGQAKYATSAATTYVGATALTEGSGGYTYTGGTRTVDYNPGGATGTVAGGGDLVLFYQASIN